jgi:hypothetical protein
VTRWRGLETNGQFRFRRRLRWLLSRLEQASSKRVGKTGRVTPAIKALVASMPRYDFRGCEEDGQADHSDFPDARHNFHFERFYEALRVRGFTIYPGKLTAAFASNHREIDERVIEPREAIRDVDAMGVKNFAA